MVAETASERRQASGADRKGVVDVLNPRERVDPGVARLLDQAAKTELQLLVHPFSLTVGLGVEPGG